MLSTVTEQAPSEMDEDEQADDDENAVLERQKRLFDRHAKAYFLALNVRIALLPAYRSC